MFHRDVLRQLMPLPLDGVHETDTEIEGKHLDGAEGSAVELLREAFADATHKLLTGFERVCGLVPGPSDTLQQRRLRVIQKLRETGGLSIPYFANVAKGLGYDVFIHELSPFMTGWGRVGDPMTTPDGIWVWQVFDLKSLFRTGMSACGDRLSVGPSTPNIYFRADASAAGERLLYFRDPVLESVFNELKPAHTLALYVYQ